jgi:Domain of unknown function (DUF6946)
VISVAVEAKAREPFGPTVKEWLRESTPGKRARITVLCQTLGVQQSVKESEIRYQLFHRAASAIIEASRIGAGTAMLLVQNFYADSTSWSDFESFVDLLGPRHVARVSATSPARLSSDCCLRGLIRQPRRTPSSRQWSTVQTQLTKARMPRRQRGTGLRSSSERVCRSALRCA